MKNNNRLLFVQIALLLFVAVYMMACEKTDKSFSIGQGTQSFQSQSTYQPRKIDILWVVDNSGSMSTSQANLTSNFRSFISRFENLNYDFHMAVAASDAWAGKYTQVGPAGNRTNITNPAAYLRWKTGSPSSGVFVMDRLTPSMDNVFLANATVGIAGLGDERVFESMEATLNYAANSDFRRADAYLAIISISDEDDFSSTGTVDINHSYTNSTLIPVSYYKTFLDNYAGVKNYTYNTISILDNACKTSLGAGRLVGQRYMQLADATGGLKVSLCGDFASQLQLISDTILEGSATYVLERDPDPTTIVVTNNGRVVPEDHINGWTFDVATRTLSFHGNEIPANGDNVQVTFDPLTQTF